MIEGKNKEIKNYVTVHLRYGLKYDQTESINQSQHNKSLPVVLSCRNMCETACLAPGLGLRCGITYWEKVGDVEEEGGQ